MRCRRAEATPPAPPIDLLDRPGCDPENPDRGNPKLFASSRRIVMTAFALAVAAALVARPAAASGACCTVSKGRSGVPSLGFALSASRSHEEFDLGRADVRQLGAIFKASYPLTPRFTLQAHVGVPLSTSVGHGGDESQGGGGSILGGGLAIVLGEWPADIEWSAAASYTDSRGDASPDHEGHQLAFTVSEVQALLVAERRLSDRSAVYGGIRLYQGRSALEDPDGPDQRGEREGTVGGFVAYRRDAGAFGYVAEAGFGHTLVLSLAAIVSF